MLRRLLIVVMLLALVAVAGGVWLVNEVNERAAAPMPITEVDRVLVEPGDTLRDVFAQLQSRGYLADDRWARAHVRLHAPGTIHTGEFALLPGDSLVDVLERLRSGQVLQHYWTVVPGWTAAQMLDSLATLDIMHTPGLTVDGLPTLLDLQETHAEGWFLPDTYAYVRGARDLNLLAMARDNMRAALETAWQDRQADLPYASPRELLIAASLVEKETGVESDRPLVASVFVRRLNLGMRLQTDPTVIYGLGEAFDGNLTRVHLRTPTPYNTYTNHGLPPTAIALPGRASLEAAAHPADTDYLYFVARGDGTSQFSRTLAEHQAAVRRYQLGR